MKKLLQYLNKFVYFSLNYPTTLLCFITTQLCLVS